VSAGDLGTDTPSLDIAIQKVVDFVQAWNDEADSFRAERGPGDVHRNTMVAVILCQIE
jgi:hypothetical protein